MVYKRGEKDRKRHKGGDKFRLFALCVNGKAGCCDEASGQKGKALKA
jgi:hypothetical protein